VLLHTTANAVTLTLLLEDFVAVNPASEIWFTPGGFGILGIALVLLAGLGLHIYRIRRNRERG
jgi:intracellular septation protein A